jgi:hypothetical protein
MSEPSRPMRDQLGRYNTEKSAGGSITMEAATITCALVDCTRAIIEALDAQRLAAVKIVDAIDRHRNSL